MSALRDKIIEIKNKNMIDNLCNRTGIGISFFDKIVNCSNGKFRKNNLDIIYDYFWLEKDEWYHDNLKKWIKPTESVLGEIFRKKRLQMWLSMEQIDKKIHVWTRQIARIEAGDSLPSFGSYTITSLLTLYDFSKEEKEKIRWFIVVLRDIVNINNNLE